MVNKKENLFKFDNGVVINIDDYFTFFYKMTVERHTPETRCFNLKHIFMNKRFNTANVDRVQTNGVTSIPSRD